MGLWLLGLRTSLLLEEHRALPGLVLPASFWVWEQALPPVMSLLGASPLAPNPCAGYSKWILTRWGLPKRACGPWGMFGRKLDTGTMTLVRALLPNVETALSGPQGGFNVSKGMWLIRNTFQMNSTNRVGSSSTPWCPQLEPFLCPSWLLLF